MGGCVLMNLGAASGQLSIIPVDTIVGAEVSINTFGAIGVGILNYWHSLFVVSIFYQFQPFFFAYIDEIHDGGFASS